MGTMQTFNPVAFDAYACLLSRPDPWDLPRRAHVVRFDGDPDRRVTRLPAILMGWLQRRHLATDIDEPVAAAVQMPRLTRHGRPNPGLRVLPQRVLLPTGTG